MLIVNPNNRLKTPLAAVEPPLWAGLISSYLKADILDTEALNMDIFQTENWIRHNRDNDVMLVVMGNNPSVSSTPKMPVAEMLADRIKDLNVSFAGLHPVAVNYNKYPVVKEPFKGFPMMPWEKLPMHLYRAHNWQCLDGSPRLLYANIYTSLGCPYSCYYCNVHTLYGDHKVRFRPISHIMKEADKLSQLGIKNIKIWDELFALKEDRVIEICKGLEIFRFNMWAYARLDTITEKMLRAMKRAGINWVAYGFESLNDPKFVRDTEDKVKMTKANGISIIANFMFGLPGTTSEDDRGAVKWAKSQLFEFVNFNTAMPYPGSQWYEDSKTATKYTNYDQYSADLPVDWSSYNQYGNMALKERDLAFTEYFTNPTYLEMITKKWGKQAETQIKEMLAWKFR